MKTSSKKSPIHHTKKIKTRLGKLVDHLRQDIEKLSDPKAQALCETSAEVLNGLIKAFGDYEKKSEAAWRTAPAVSHSKERASRVARR